MRRVMKALILTAIVGVAAPSQARAEGYVSPWAGVNFASGLDSIDNGRGAFGVNAGGMGAGIIGGEVSFGYSPCTEVVEISSPPSSFQSARPQPSSRASTFPSGAIEPSTTA